VTHAERFDIKYDGKLIRLSVKLRLVSDDLVVLLHGFGCAKECFDEAFVAEGLQDLSICTFDFPGHGDSERSNSSILQRKSLWSATAWVEPLA
jgi:pimeloyl-ACP methyl ester carboxylesterase